MNPNLTVSYFLIFSFSSPIMRVGRVHNERPYCKGLGITRELMVQRPCVLERIKEFGVKKFEVLWQM